MAPPLVVTKHSDARFLESIREGSLLLGSVAKFSRQERGTSGGALSDPFEGQATEFIRGPLNIRELRIGTHRFHNIRVSDSPPGGALAVFCKFDCFVYCASDGPYWSPRHLRILNGDHELGYEANENYTAYVEYDSGLLALGILHALQEKFPELNVDAVHMRRVLYEDRRLEVSLPDIENESRRQESFERALFFKPTKFGLEEEIRFVPISRERATIVPPNGPVLLNSKELKSAIRKSGIVRDFERNQH